MWRCRGCKETIDEEFDACWRCGTERGKTTASSHHILPTEPLLSNGLPRSQVLSNASGSRESEIVQALTRRYRDAYRSAHWLIQLGGLIKIAAIVLVVAISALSMVASDVLSFAGPVGVIVGILMFVPIYILGVLTSGQGQTNLATLDTAVNTSRHLSKDDVAALLFD